MNFVHIIKRDDDAHKTSSTNFFNRLYSSSLKKKLTFGNNIWFYFHLEVIGYMSDTKFSIINYIL